MHRAISLFVFMLIALHSFADFQTPMTDTIEQAAKISEVLTAQETSIAETLSPLHRKVFTDIFTKEQRQKTLGYFQTKSPRFKGLTADQAVEYVLRDYRILPLSKHSFPPTIAKR